MADNEESSGSEGLKSPLSRLPPLAAAAVAAAMASASGASWRSPAPGSASSPQPGGPSGLTPDWLHYSASSSDGDSLAMSPVARRKGKEVVPPSGGCSDLMAAPSRANPGGFMADARRVARVAPHPAHRQHPASVVVAPHPRDAAGEDGGWVEVRRRWRRRVRHPRPPPRPVPADLVKRCFNSFPKDHVAAACRNPSRCLKCSQEGQQARHCKRGRVVRGGLGRAAPSWAPVAGASHCIRRLGAAPSRRGSAGSDDTRSARSQSTGRASSLPEICAPSSCRDAADDGTEGASPPSSSPPSIKPFGDPSRRPRSEICVVQRSSEIEATEARLLSCALVAVVGGTRSSVSFLQVGMLLEEFFSVQHGEYTVHRFDPEDFLVEFSNAADADRVLHAHYPEDAPFCLVWKRWRRQSMASFGSFRFRVPIEFTGIPAHARNISTARFVLETSCSDLIEAPPELTGDDQRKFYICAWCFHPDLVPQQKVIFIHEPPEQYVESGLFLRPHEIIQSKHDGLRYNVHVRIIEVQDWNLPSDSSDDVEAPPLGLGGVHHSVRAPNRLAPELSLFCGRLKGGGPNKGKENTQSKVEVLLDHQVVNQPSKTTGRLAPLVGLEVDPGQLRAPGAADPASTVDDPMVVESLLRPKEGRCTCLDDHSLLGTGEHALVSLAGNVVPPPTPGKGGPSSLVACALEEEMAGFSRGSEMVDTGTASAQAELDDAPSGGPAMSGPQLEGIRFPDVGVDGVHLNSPVVSRNVNTNRGSRPTLPLHIFDGVASPTRRAVQGFMKKVTKSRPPAAIALTPPRRRAKSPDQKFLCRRSERLARKSRARASNPEVQAQNVMMRSLGITSDSRLPDANAFDEFVVIFTSPLTPSKQDALNLLFPLSVPMIARLAASNMADEVEP
ncbi:hypothetical protein C2845_PM11G18690 [Panicum miliaceum]|uniref:CCHC-type domain-containing protein n=1 Tax=Panicum miliaceum TaxID=4540 RepID=A0A3L6RVL6_PANMI|nr:hypothetical protein C2845_PM11G18690 [Panicum miliaceum]